MTRTDPSEGRIRTGSGPAAGLHRIRRTDGRYRRNRAPLHGRHARAAEAGWHRRGTGSSTINRNSQHVGRIRAHHEVIAMSRTFVVGLGEAIGRPVLLRGWVHRLRELSRVVFIVLQDATGSVQCVAEPSLLEGLGLKLDDAVEIDGTVRADERSRVGFEVEVKSVRILNPSGFPLPFNSGTPLDGVALEVILEHRPLSLRSPSVGTAFRVQAEIVCGMREFLAREYFTEIFTSKIVGGPTRTPVIDVRIRATERGVRSVFRWTWDSPTPIDARGADLGVRRVPRPASQGVRSLRSRR